MKTLRGTVNSEASLATLKYWNFVYECFKMDTISWQLSSFLIVHHINGHVEDLLCYAIAFTGMALASSWLLSLSVLRLMRTLSILRRLLIDNVFPGRGKERRFICSNDIIVVWYNGDSGIIYCVRVNHAAGRYSWELGACSFVTPRISTGL